MPTTIACSSAAGVRPGCWSSTRSPAQPTGVDIVGDTDDIFYDAGSQRVFVIGGEGYLDVLDVRPGATPTRLERLPTAAGARTGLYVPAQNRIYVAVPHRGAQKAEVSLRYQVRQGASLHPRCCSCARPAAGRAMLAIGLTSSKAAKERGLNVTTSFPAGPNLTRSIGGHHSQADYGPGVCRSHRQAAPGHGRRVQDLPTWSFRMDAT